MKHVRQMGRALALAAGMGVLAATDAPAGAADVARGQALYENHCEFCHESWVHKRDGRHIRTLAELRLRVEAWSVHSGLDWSAQEIDDVTDYLSRNFYRITE